MVQQTNVPVGVRINALEMEISLCKQQIAVFDNAIVRCFFLITDDEFCVEHSLISLRVLLQQVEKKRRRAAEEELASVKYHPLRDLGDTGGHSSGCRVRSKRLKHSSMVND